MTNISNAQSNLSALIDVHQQHNKIVTTSRNVAMVFNKEHRNVIRDIKNIFVTNSDHNFNALNFECVEYKDNKGELRPEYFLTRDGCMLLVMGYTGAKAMELKVAYINRFNEMEQALHALQEPATESKALDEIPLNLSYKKQMVALADKYHMTAHDILVLDNISVKSRRQGYGIACSNFEKEFRSDIKQLSDETGVLGRVTVRLAERLAVLEGR